MDQLWLCFSCITSSAERLEAALGRDCGNRGWRGGCRRNGGLAVVPPEGRQAVQAGLGLGQNRGARAADPPIPFYESGATKSGMIPCTGDDSPHSPEGSRIRALCDVMVLSAPKQRRQDSKRSPMSYARAAPPSGGAAPLRGAMRRTCLGQSQLGVAIPAEGTRRYRSSRK